MSRYLPGVEAGAKPGTYATLVDKAKAAGGEYSKIWDLFAFQPETNHHLSHFTQGVMRRPASISPGLRELVAAYTSYCNDCRFCTMAHAAAAGELLGDEALVWGALRNLEGSALDEKHKALLRFVGKVTRDLPAVWRDDVAALRAMGWDDEAIYFAISVCALFNFYNRWIDATGVHALSDDAHRAGGKRSAQFGYVRNARLAGLMAALAVKLVVQLGVPDRLAQQVHVPGDVGSRHVSPDGPGVGAAGAGQRAVVVLLAVLLPASDRVGEARQSPDRLLEGRVAPQRRAAQLDHGGARRR